MSTKTTFKRVALVAVASLGFGMLSVAPSNAAAAAVTALTVGKASANTDASLFIAPASGSALSLSYNVYTSNATVSIANIAATITSAGDTTAGFRQITAAAGTVTELRATAATAFVKTAALTTATATALVDASGTGPFTTFAASAAGTTYVLFNDGIKAADGLVSAGGADQKPGTDEALVTLVFYQTSATTSIASSAVTGNGAASPAIGPNGQAGAYRIRFTTPNTTDTVNPAARITSVPAGSKILNQNPLNSYYPVNNSSATSITAASGVVNGSAAYLTNSTTTLAAVAASAAKVADTNFYLWADVAGTYTVVFFDDRNSNGIVDGNDVSTTVSYVVGGAVSTATITNLGGDAPTTATNPGGST